jgi:hypothetical protein
VKKPYPFKTLLTRCGETVPLQTKTITMLCIGTGIAPMYQALHKLLQTEEDTTQVVLLYGNRTPTDILLRVELEAYAKTHAHRFKLVHVVGHGKDDSPEGWDGEKGWIDEEKVRRYASPGSRHERVRMRLARYVRCVLWPERGGGGAGRDRVAPDRIQNGDGDQVLSPRKSKTMVTYLHVAGWSQGGLQAERGIEKEKHSKQHPNELR